MLKEDFSIRLTNYFYNWFLEVKTDEKTFQRWLKYQSLVFLHINYPQLSYSNHQLGGIALAVWPPPILGLEPNHDIFHSNVSCRSFSSSGENFNSVATALVKCWASYSRLVRNLIITCFKYLKLTSSSSRLTLTFVKFLVEEWLGIKMAAELVSFISLLNDELPGVRSSCWRAFFMSANRSWSIFMF